MTILSDGCKKLGLIDLFRFYSSHQGTKLVIGSAQEQWDTLFKEYQWVDDVRLRGQTPILMFVDGEWPYVYLLLASRENEKREIDPKPQTEQEEQDLALFEKIKKSLRSSTCGTDPFEVQFGNCTLDMSNIVLHGIHNCRHLFQAPSKNVVMAIYEENLENVEANIFHNQMALIKLEGFRLLTFLKDSGHNSIILAACRSAGGL